MSETINISRGFVASSLIYLALEHANFYAQEQLHKKKPPEKAVRKILPPAPLKPAPPKNKNPWPLKRKFGRKMSDFDKNFLY